MWKFLRHLLVAFGFLALAQLGYSASIQKCSKKAKTCDIKLEEGFVGDSVSILNERAQPIAVGWIVKRSGSYGVIKFKEIFRDVRIGFPVIVNTDNRGKKDRQLGSRV